MASVLNTVLGDALTVIAQEAEAYKPQILAAAASANVTVEAAVDTFIASIKVNGALGLVLPSLKSAIVSAIHNEISANAATEEGVLFDLIITSAQNEAKKLLA